MEDNEIKQGAKNDEVVFSDILKILLKYFYLIIAAALLAAVTVFVYLRFISTPVYTATASLYVDILSEDDKAETSSINSAAAVANDYGYLLKSKKILDNVIAQLQPTDETYSSLTKKINVSLPIPHAIEISVTDRNPEYCVAVANALSSSARQILPEYTSIQLKEIDAAVLPEQPDSNGLIKFTLLAAFLGAAVASLSIITVFLLDDRLKSAADIENRLGLSVLGIIPDIKSSRKAETKSVNRVN